MDDKRDVIFNIQNLKETEELIEIWQKSDREEWSEEALGVIREILLDRLGYLPKVLTPEEQIDEYSPEFYSPKEVNKLTKWLRYFPALFLCVIIVRQILTFGELRSYVSSVMYSFPIMVSFVSVIFFIINIIISFVLYCVPMIILRVILQNLLQMEQNSRRPSAI
jgi:hypothetical protein